MRAAHDEWKRRMDAAVDQGSSLGAIRMLRTQFVSANPEPPLPDGDSDGGNIAGHAASVPTPTVTEVWLWVAIQIVDGVEVPTRLSGGDAFPHNAVAEYLSALEADEWRLARLDYDRAVVHRDQRSHSEITRALLLLHRQQG